MSAAAAAATNSNSTAGAQPAPAPLPASRYESQKRRDWTNFGQYLRNHSPPLAISRCSGANVLEFFRYLDQFGKTKVHAPACPFFGHPHPPEPCPCPLRQAWGSLDALVGRLRAAFEENGGQPDANPFGSHAVRVYLREVRKLQARARGIAFRKKKQQRPRPRPRPLPPLPEAASTQPTTLPPMQVSDLNPGLHGHGVRSAESVESVVMIPCTSSS